MDFNIRPSELPSGGRIQNCNHTTILDAEGTKQALKLNEQFKAQINGTGAFDERTACYNDTGANSKN
ncbi:hypothetical protein RIVM261_074120 [Rivularia sp. IAM M-261]|nr:hypothetical protein CAL7716_047250 [Calothrix sp. PCC 7716]GJD22456.1 hypothetical protein RIVM261_074120 [Rivularia sp. IAM M-261]